MPSYQDIEMRLKVIEDKMDFVMKNFRMKAFRGTGLVNPDGSPQGQLIETDLLGVYHLARQASQVGDATDELKAAVGRLVEADEKKETENAVV